MVDPTSPSNQLSQDIEQKVRTLIGDLQMQIIILRSMLELAQQQVPQPTATPQPEPKPQPTVRVVNGARPTQEAQS